MGRERDRDGRKGIDGGEEGGNPPSRRNQRHLTVHISVTFRQFVALPWTPRGRWRDGSTPKEQRKEEERKETDGQTDVFGRSITRV